MRNAPLKFQPFPADGINAGSEGKPAPTNVSTSLTLAAMSLGYGVVQLDVTIVNTALNSIGTSRWRPQRDPANRQRAGCRAVRLAGRSGRRFHGGRACGADHLGE